MSRQLISVALNERIVSARSGWVRGFGLLFGVGMVALALMTATAGARFSGLGFDRATATALSMMLLSVPLVSLILGANTMAVSRGTWEMLASQPVATETIVTGKWIGVWMGVGGAVSVAFGLSGILLFVGGDGAGAGAYVTLGFCALLLVAVFSGLGMLVGTVVTERSRALFMALVLWIVAVFFYDWAVMGVALMTGKRLSVAAVWAALVVNPIDLARVITVSNIGALDLLGPTGAVMARAGPQAIWALWGGLVVWAIVPVFIAGKVAKIVER